MFRWVIAAMSTLAMCTWAYAQENNVTKTIPELLAMESTVISANNDYVWVLLESEGTELRVLYLCLYDADRPNAKSYCVPIS